jgi:hypothetical protein
MSEQEMSENEVMWAEETGEAAVNDGADIDSAAGLRSVGITPGGIDTDLESVSMPEPGGEDLGGMEMSPGPGGAAPAAPEAMPTTAPTPPGL